jgi:hypothetical protein
MATETVNVINVPSWAKPQVQAISGFANYYTMQRPDGSYYSPSTLTQNFGNIRGGYSGVQNALQSGTGYQQFTPGQPFGYPTYPGPLSGFQYGGMYQPQMSPFGFPNQGQYNPYNQPARPVPGTTSRFATTDPNPRQDANSGRPQPGTGAILDPNSNFFENPDYDPSLDPAQNYDGNPTSPIGDDYGLLADSPTSSRGEGRSKAQEDPALHGGTTYSPSEETEEEEEESSIIDDIRDYFTPTTTYPGPTTGPAAVPGGTLNPTKGEGSDGSEGVKALNEGDQTQTNTSSESGNQVQQQTQVAFPDDYLTAEQLQNFLSENFIDPSNVNPTPFSSYTRQRFAAPSDLTQAAEAQLANQYGTNMSEAYNQLRFLSQGGSAFGGNPQGATNYTSAVNANPLSFAAANFSPVQTQAGRTFSTNTFTPVTALGPDAYQTRQFDAIQNFQPANRTAAQGYDSLTYNPTSFGNATQNLADSRDYQRGDSFAAQVNERMNPYTDQVINNTINDLNEARQLADQQVSDQAISRGAFGGSRQALLESENYDKYLQSVGDTSAKLRASGYQQAADQVAADAAQRLGLTADSFGLSQQLGTQGALQGQNLSASDIQNARGLSAQSNLQAQQLGAQSDRMRDTLTQEAALAAQQANLQAGLQGQDLTSRSSLQAQDLTANSRNLYNQLMMQGGLQNQNLTAQDLSQARALGADSYQQAANNQLQSLLAAQGLGAQSLNNINNINAGLINQANALNAQGALQGQSLGAQSQLAFANRELEAQRLAEAYRQSARGQAIDASGMMGTIGNQMDSLQRQQIMDRLAAGGAQDQRNQQDLDFMFNEFQRELGYPGEQVNLQTSAISPAIGSVQQKTSPLYPGGGGNSLLPSIGSGLMMYGLGMNPYLAASIAGLNYFSGNDNNPLSQFFG